MWLQDHVAGQTLEEKSDIYTRSEELAKQVEGVIILLVRESSDRSRWTEERFQARLNSSNITLRSALEELIQLVDNKKHVVPAFWDVLHDLYTAYDVVKTIFDFSNYVLKQIKESPDTLKEICNAQSERSHVLLQIVLEQVQAVKKGLDEGGWIDKLLEGSLPGSGGPYATGQVIRDLLGENSLEEWAGLVVESWGESVQGLNLIRSLE